MSFEDSKPLHALLSPSGADRWMVCTGSIALGMNEPDDTSDYADEGTAAHWIGADVLRTSIENGVHDDPVRYLDRKIIVVNGVVWPGGDAPRPPKLKGRTHDIEREIVVDSEMVMHVRRYVNNIRQYAKGHTIYIEQQLPIGHITGEKDATGTGDVVILTNDGVEIQAHDLKFGRGVEVRAENNRQLKLYGLGVLEKFGEEIEVEHGQLPTRFRAVIHQPRIREAPDEWDCSIEELVAWGRDEVAPTAKTVLAIYRDHKAGITLPPDQWNALVPGVKQCQFCKAKPICPKLAAFVEENVGADFLNLDSIEPSSADAVKLTQALVPNDFTSLGIKARAYDLIEMWGKAVRAKIEHVLLETRNSDDVVKALGYKLVQGKKGNRKWRDESTVEQMLKKMRLKQEEIYTFNLKSPPQLEKELKDQPKRWAKLQEHIDQSPGGPSVQPLDDKRPALRMADPADDFEAADAIVTKPGENLIDTVSAARAEDDEDDFSDIA